MLTLFVINNYNDVEDVNTKSMSVVSILAGHFWCCILLLAMHFTASSPLLMAHISKLVDDL